MSVPASDLHALAQFLLQLAEIRVRSGQAEDLAAGLAGALGVVAIGDPHRAARRAGIDEALSAASDAFGRARDAMEQARDHVGGD